MKKLLGIVVLVVGFYRTLGKKLEDFEIKQGLDWHEQRKRK